MTPGSCALCLDGCKSQLYGGPRQGRPETRVLALFPASHPDRTTIFRRGDGRGAREGSGGTARQVLPLSQMLTASMRGLRRLSG